MNSTCSVSSLKDGDSHRDGGNFTVIVKNPIVNSRHGSSDIRYNSLRNSYPIGGERFLSLLTLTKN